MKNKDIKVEKLSILLKFLEIYGENLKDYEAKMINVRLKEIGIKTINFGKFGTIKL